MDKFFNTAGPCRAELHYMIDPMTRLNGVRKLIDNHQYFSIYGPRQTGKTTCLYALMEELNQQGTYTALVVNIQVAASGRDSYEAMRMIAAAIYRQATLHLIEPEWPASISEQDTQFDNLQDYLSDWARHNRKPIVLFIDEIDALNEHYFVALMRQIRAGFEGRPRGFPQSIGLIGLRDVQDYTAQQQTSTNEAGNEPGVETPFNVKSTSLSIDNLTSEQMDELLCQHTQATGQEFPEELRENLFDLTQGQPWLVNAIADLILSDILGNDYYIEIKQPHLIRAQHLLLERRETHIDNILKKLRERPVRLVIEAIINGEAPDFSKFKDALAYARSTGIVTCHPPVRFANPIYQELALKTMCSVFTESLPTDLVDIEYYWQGNELSVDELLEEFQLFYQRFAETWIDRYEFKEAGRQLLFIAFLMRLTHGQADFEWDMALGHGRCCVTVNYMGQRMAFVMKLRHDNYSREEGLNQTMRYLKQINLEQGYLLLFDLFWEERVYREELEYQNKYIILLGM